MSRARSVASLCRRAAASLGGRPPAVSLAGTAGVSLCRPWTGTTSGPRPTELQAGSRGGSGVKLSSASAMHPACSPPACLLAHPPAQQCLPTFQSAHIPACLPVRMVSRCQAARPVVTSAAAGAAVSGTMMRVLGVDVPYAYVIGTGELLAACGEWVRWRGQGATLDPVDHSVRCAVLCCAVLCHPGALDG